MPTLDLVGVGVKPIGMVRSRRSWFCLKDCTALGAFDFACFAVGKDSFVLQVGHGTTVLIGCAETFSTLVGLLEWVSSNDSVSVGKAEGALFLLTVTTQRLTFAGDASFKIAGSK